MVYAVSTNEGTLFSNKAGDKVLFDGWMVRKVSGLGRGGLDIKIDELGGFERLRREQGPLRVTDARSGSVRRVRAWLVCYRIALELETIATASWCLRMAVFR